MTKGLELRMRKSKHYGLVARACDERPAPPVTRLPHNRGRGECHRLDAGQAVCTGANVPRAAEFTHRWSPRGRAPFLFFVAHRVLGRVRLDDLAALEIAEQTEV
jgi:hypothetical protein